MTKTRVVHGWKRNFLRHIGRGRPVTTSAKLAMVGLDRLYREKEQDPEFAREWDAAAKNAGQPVNW